jgi:hypothetical protein
MHVYYKMNLDYIYRTKILQLRFFNFLEFNVAYV